MTDIRKKKDDEERKKIRKNDQPKRGREVGKRGWRNGSNGYSGKGEQTEGREVRGK